MRPSLFLLLATLGTAQAQELRDPTSWPVGVQAPTSNRASGTGPEAEASGPKIQQIVIADGRPYVIYGGRRYGVGAQFGDAKIMRIEDQAVWLRDASGTRRESLYPGIEKRASAAATPAASAPKKKTKRAGASASAQEKS